MDRWEAAFFEELLLTSSEESSEDEFEVRGPMAYKPRIEDYIENVVDNYSEEEFRENFRMYRRTFEHLLSLIKHKISSNIVDTGRHTISPKSQLLIALWYFATPDSYRSLCCRFNIGRATGLRTVRRVCDALMYLAPTIIHWPTGDYLEAVKEGFLHKGFPNTIGCIDGCHIPIPLPKEHGLSYINRKNFASLILQGVCDHNMKFIHCYTGEAGATHDARVLRRSEVWKNILERPEETFPQDTHIIGDKAYPCISQLITPYKDNGHLTEQQRHFNYLLCSARSTIERAFGLLTKRMRCLKFLDVRCLDWAVKYIIACCVIHNICIMQNDILELTEEDIVNFNDGAVEEIDNIGDINRQRVQQGTQKRNRLCAQLNEN